MAPAIQDTLLQLFDHVRQDPVTMPTVPVEDWQEGSVEWRLLSGFQDMLEQVQQRMLQFAEMEQQLREKEEQYRSVFEATSDGLIIRDMDGLLSKLIRPRAVCMDMPMRSLSACIALILSILGIMLWWQNI